MSNFWASKLGRPSPPQQPPGSPQYGAPASSRPWWDQSAPPPSPGPQNPAQGYSQQDPGDLSPEEIQRHTKSARKARNSRGECPECGGSNYTTIGTKFFKNAGAVTQQRCFDCGYPITQQFSGMSGVSGGKVAGHARQVAHGGGDVYNFSGQSTQAPAFAAEHGGPGR